MKYMLTTVDNPYDPFDNFKEWYMYDVQKGYNSSSYLARIAKMVKCLPINTLDEEIDKYLLHLQDILNFANIVNNAPVEGLSESFGVNENYNVFRKDEIKVFEDNEALLQNAPSKEFNMFKIPKVIN